MEVWRRQEAVRWLEQKARGFGGITIAPKRRGAGCLVAASRVEVGPLRLRRQQQLKSGLGGLRFYRPGQWPVEGSGCGGQRKRSLLFHGVGCPTASQRKQTTNHGITTPVHVACLPQHQSASKLRKVRLFPRFISPSALNIYSRMGSGFSRSGSPTSLRDLDTFAVSAHGSLMGWGSKLLVDFGMRECRTAHRRRHQGDEPAMFG